MSSSHISLEHVGRHIVNFLFFFAASRMGLGEEIGKTYGRSGHFSVMNVLIQMVVESSLGFFCKNRGELM